MNAFKTVFSAIIATVLFAGCASNDSYNTSRRDAVPVNELGARGAQFAGQAQQFHQNNMDINVCPRGVIEKSGGGSVNSGAGDDNGKVTYNITTTSTAKTVCDFSPTPKTDRVTTLVDNLGGNATQNADKPAGVAQQQAPVKADKPAGRTGKQQP